MKMTDLITQQELVDIGIRIIISTFLLLIITGLSMWQKTKLERMFIISFIRGLVQIVILGFVLIVLFELEDIIILYLYLLGMSTFAAYTARNRYKFFDIFKIELIAITVGGFGIMVLVTTIGIIKPSGEFIIPMGGMVISNAMVMTTIVFERLTADIQKSKGVIEAALSLGDSPRNAIKPIIQDSIRAALVPTTNRVAVLGIVTIPGLMSGMIIGGTNPVVAAVYQVIIFLMILSAGFISAIIISYLFVSEIFNKDEQLTMKITFNQV